MQNAQPTGSVRQVRTLLCHRDAEMGLMTLGSLLARSVDPLELVVHDDGSLTAEDKDRLTEQLGARVVGRPEADDLTAGLLRNRPAARAFRASGRAYALKLVDICAMAEGEVNYIDSDVVFYRPFSGLFEPPPGVGALMMTDIRDAWSLSFVSWPEAPRLLPSRLNGGLVHFGPGAYDLDFVEHFLSKRRYNALPFFTDQTCMAALAKRAVVHSYDTAQIRLVIDEDAELPAVAGHYTTPFRSWIWAAGQRAADGVYAPGDVVRVKTVKAPDATVVGVARSTMRYNLGVRKHRIQRRFGLRA